MKIERVPYSEMKLFAGFLSDYTNRYDRFSEYYAANPAEEGDLKRCAEQALAVERPRAALAAALEKYNLRLGASEAALANIAQLRNTDCAAVLTGQQPGLLGGPLYTAYKALTAIRLARFFKDDLGVPCVPLFWNASDGHDAREYASVTMPAADGGPVRRTLRDIPRAASAFDVTVAQECLNLLNEYCTSLPQTEFRGGIADMLAASYEGNLAESFSRVMLRLFSEHGLVLVEPRLFRKEAAAIITREIETRGESSAAIREARRSLEQAGFAPPLTGTEGIKAFIHEEGRRRRIQPSEGGFSSREREYSTGELLKVLEREPERFSPDAALRPIVQDALLPTAAYVAGPTEVAYFAQLKNVYRFFDVPMPVIYPRASATLVDRNAARILENFHLDVKGFLNGAQPPEDVLNSAKDDGLEKGFAEMLAELEKRLVELREMTLKHEPTLDGPFGRSERNIRSEITKLREKAVAARLNRLGIGRRQWSRIGGALLPEGKLQERVCTATPWLCRYGLNFLDSMLERLPFRQFCHTIVYLD